MDLEDCEIGGSVADLRGTIRIKKSYTYIGMLFVSK